MTILDEIVAEKKREVSERRELYPIKLLEKSIYFPTPCVSLSAYLKRADKVGVIAEIKRRSPSKGILHPNVSVEQLSVGYMQAGASALSVLTDTKYFGGKSDDLTVARRFNYCPILRKDFVIDEYQVVEAKSLGADVVLLIAAILEPAQARDLAAAARSLGLEVLLEVHERSEIEPYINDDIGLIGVNNRDLSDFSVDHHRSIELSSSLPKGVTRISESGISSASTIKELKRAGYDGFLIGESFMKTAKPEEACRSLISEVLRND